MQTIPVKTNILPKSYHFDRLKHLKIELKCEHFLASPEKYPVLIRALQQKSFTCKTTSIYKPQLVIWK